MPGVFFVLAEGFDQVGIGQQVDRYLDSPRFRVRFGIFNGDVHFEMPEILACETLGNFALFRQGMALASVDPCFAVEPDGFNYQRVAFPMADGVTEPAGLRICGRGRPSMKIWRKVELAEVS